jgi:hypothetical protein
LVWQTLFGGQRSHRCPSCERRFRLTYASKIRVGYLNVMLILGIAILVGVAFLAGPVVLALSALVYAVAAAIILAVLPHQARYEKTSAPYR